MPVCLSIGVIITHLPSNVELHIAVFHPADPAQQLVDAQRRDGGQQKVDQTNEQERVRRCPMVLSVVNCPTSPLVPMPAPAALFVMPNSAALTTPPKALATVGAIQIWGWRSMLGT